MKPSGSVGFDAFSIFQIFFMIAGIWMHACRDFTAKVLGYKGEAEPSASVDFQNAILNAN